MHYFWLSGRSGNQPRLPAVIEPAHLALVAEVRTAAVVVANANDCTGALVSGPEVEQLAEALEAVLFYAASSRPVTAGSSFASTGDKDHASNKPAATAAWTPVMDPEKSKADETTLDKISKEEAYELGHFWEVVLAANSAASSTVAHANSAGATSKRGGRALSPPRALPNSRPVAAVAASAPPSRDTSLLNRAFRAVNPPALARVRTLRGVCRAFVRALLTLPPPTSNAGAGTPDSRGLQVRRSAGVRNLATELDTVFKSLAQHRSALITCYAPRKRFNHNKGSASSPAGAETKTEIDAATAGAPTLSSGGGNAAVVAAVGTLPPPPSADEDDALVGQRVQLRGLQASPENNGTWGAALFYDATAGRYAVQLDSGGDPVMLRAVNLLSPQEAASAAIAASGATPDSSSTVVTLGTTTTTVPSSASTNAARLVDASVALTPALASEAALEALAGALATLHPLTKKRQRLWLCVDSSALDLPPSTRIMEYSTAAKTVEVAASAFTEGKLAYSLARQNLQLRSLVPWSPQSLTNEDVVVHDDTESHQTHSPLEQGSVPLAFELIFACEALGDAGAAMGGIYFEDKGLSDRDKSAGRLHNSVRFTNGQGFEIFRANVVTFCVPLLRPKTSVAYTIAESTNSGEEPKVQVNDNASESLTAPSPVDDGLCIDDNENVGEKKDSDDNNAGAQSSNVENTDEAKDIPGSNLDEIKDAAVTSIDEASQRLACSRWFVGSIQQRRAYFSAPSKREASGALSSIPPLNGWQLAPAAAAAAGYSLPTLRALTDSEAASAWRARCDAAAGRDGASSRSRRRRDRPEKDVSEEDKILDNHDESGKADVDDSDDSQLDDFDEIEEWPVAHTRGTSSPIAAPTVSLQGNREVAIGMPLPPPLMSPGSERRVDADNHSHSRSRSSTEASESDEEIFEVGDANSKDSDSDGSENDSIQGTTSKPGIVNSHCVPSEVVLSATNIEPGPQVDVLRKDDDEVTATAGAQPEAMLQVSAQLEPKVSADLGETVAATVAAKRRVRVKPREVELDVLTAVQNGVELSQGEALSLFACLGQTALTTAATIQTGQTFAQALASAEAVATAPPVSLFEEHTDAELQLSAEQRFTTFVRELERQRASEIAIASKRHFQRREKFCKRRSQLEAKGESVAGEAAALRAGLGLPPRSLPMIMPPPVQLLSSLQQDSLSAQTLNHEPCSNGSSSSSSSSSISQAERHGGAAALHGLREGFSFDRRETSVSIACTRAEAWLRRKGVDVDGDNEASAQRQRYPPTLEEVMQEVRLLKASAVEEEEESTASLTSKVEAEGRNYDSNDSLAAVPEATVNSVKTTHFFGGGGGSNSGDVSSNGEASSSSAAAASEPPQAPVAVVPPPQAPVLSSKALLARLREEGRRLIWLPPEAATSELTVAEVLSGSSSSNSSSVSGGGQDPSDLFVLRLTRCTTEVTPLVQPSVASSSGQAAEDAGSSEAAAGTAAASGGSTVESGVRYEMEHMSRVEVATVRVPLGALEATHAAIEQSLLYLLQDRLRHKRARKKKTQQTDARRDDDITREEGEVVSLSADTGHTLNNTTNPKRSLFADDDSDQNGDSNIMSSIDEQDKVEEEERVLRVPGLPAFPATAPHVDASDVASAATNNNSNTSSAGSWFRNLGSVGLASPGGLSLMSGGLGSGLNGSLGLGNAKNAAATRDKLVADLNSWLAGLLALQFSPDFQDDNDDNNGDGEEQEDEEFAKGAVSSASTSNNGSKYRSHDDDDEYEYEESVRASVSGGHSTRGRAAARASAAAGAAEVVGAFLWQLRLLSHPPGRSPSQQQSSPYSETGALGLDGSSSSGGAWWSAGIAALAASGGAGGLGTGSLGNIGFGSGVNNSSGGAGNGTHGASSQSHNDAGPSGAADLNLGPSGFVEVNLRVDDFNPWEIQTDASDALLESGSSSSSRVGSGGVGLGAGGGGSNSSSTGTSKSGSTGKASKSTKRKATAALASRSDEDQLRVQGYMCPGCGTPLAAALFAKAKISFFLHVMWGTPLPLSDQYIVVTLISFTCVACCIYDNHHQAYAPCRYLDALFCRKTCHVDEHRILPHRVLHYWDFVPHRVRFLRIVHVLKTNKLNDGNIGSKVLL